jgi:gluconolactonase
VVAALAALGVGPVGAAAPAALDPGARRPDAVVDLATAEGAKLVQAVWRYADARIVEVEHRAPGPDRKASGPPNRTFDVLPRAGAADFDDGGWEVLDPATLDARRSTGRLAFGWYRTQVVLPERAGKLETTGALVALEIVVDDYAEVWVDGKLTPVLGQRGGALAAGYNAPNRVVLTRDARPGQRFQLAVFAANAPLSSPPGNFVWIRSATLDFHGPERGRPARPVELQVLRKDPALDAIVPHDATLELLAEGFSFVEGPVWHPDGYLLFSDPNDNRIYRWTSDGELSVYRVKSGYSGLDIGEYGQPGSNGLALDAEGRLTICEHGNRRVTRLEPNGVVTVLADRLDGRRLNSPNDLVWRSDGSLYFTDPPFGLPVHHADPRRELEWTGVYRWADGRLQLVAKDLAGPNGLAFSPDERWLYVANWDVAHKVVMRYPLRADGTLGAGEALFDMTGAPGEEALDGLKVDRLGNLYVSGPGGLWILSAEGRHLGTLVGPELPANFAWGDEDGRTLYLTARTGLYRIRLSVPGAVGR